MKFLLKFAAAALACAPVLSAQSPKPVSLDDCVQLALQQNLDIRIARFAPELTRLDLAVTQGFYDPTFSAGIGQAYSKSAGVEFAPGQFSPPVEQDSDRYNASLRGNLPTGGDLTLQGNLTRNESGGNLTYIGGASVNFSQPLLKDLWIDQTRWSIQVNRRLLKQDQQTLRSQIITIITDIQTAYYNLAVARAAVRVQEKALELAERSLAENKKRVEVGAMAPLEEKQTEAQVASSRADLLTARQNYAIAQNTLKRLVTDDFASLTDELVPTEQLVPSPYAFSRQDSWHKGLTMRPDIIQSQLQLEQQNITLKFRRNQLYPALDLAASYGVTARSGNAGGSSAFFDQIADRDNPNHSYGLTLTIPLSNRAERYRYRAAKVEQERLLLRHKQLEQNVMVAIDNSILTAQSAFERMEATRQARVYAEEALAAEQKKLENGKSTSFVVLSLQRDLTAASSAELQAIADYYKALAVLHQDEGATLEALGISLEFE